MIDVIEQPTETRPERRPPSGWYDPDSSAFEEMVGTASVNDAMADSLESDRSRDLPPEDADTN